jgi:hypothetical protein
MIFRALSSTPKGVVPAEAAMLPVNDNVSAMNTER